MARSELPFRIEERRIWIAGHRGMVGSALMRRLAREDCELVTVDRDRLDLRHQAEVGAWMHEVKPDVVILVAARVGGIHANASRPADFLDDNLALQTNVIHAAAEIGVRKLLFLGSSCIYPRLAPQPISESSLLTGPLEPTNQWYAIAKIAGLMQCQAYREQHGCDFISAMPTNLYGPGDNFDLESAMSCRRSCAGSAPPHSPATARSRSGAPARRAGNSSMSMIAPTRSCSCSGTIRMRAPSTSASAAMSRSLNWRASLPAWSDIRARSGSTPRDPTAHRASSWM